MYSNLTPSYHSVPGERAPFICSLDDGMRYCKDIPPYREGNLTCTLPAPHLDPLASTRNGSECVNWNAYYNICRSSGENPNLNSINFDNIGYSWIAVFQVSSRFFSIRHSVTFSIYATLSKVFNFLISHTYQPE